MSSIGTNCRNVVAATAVAVVAVLGVGCGGGEPDTVDPGSANPDSSVTVEEAQAPVKQAPPELVAIRDEANEILDEGTEGYQARIAELEGTPVVVNNWASWCGPCREEIPYFQAQAIEQGGEIAFLGLLSGDGPETGETFLSEFPLPYPSYLDPDFDASIDIGTGKRLPSTAFYDSSGELVYLKAGPYGSAEELAGDIKEYAQ
jgi:thiol-disulfide isomerase/thioredoxin